MFDTRKLDILTEFICTLTNTNTSLYSTAYIVSRGANRMSPVALPECWLRRGAAVFL